MDIASLVSAVEAFFIEIDLRIATFRSESGVHCPPGCSRCCEYPDIRTTVLEFLPLAKELWDSGCAVDVYRRVCESESLCAFYRCAGEASEGRCDAYARRGLLCRAFGFGSAVGRDGVRRFSSCRTISGLLPDRGDGLSAAAWLHGLPSGAELCARLTAIDPVLGSERLPVNAAIKRAIETVFSAGYVPPGPEPDADPAPERAA